MGRTLAKAAGWARKIIYYIPWSSNPDGVGDFSRGTNSFTEVFRVLGSFETFSVGQRLPQQQTSYRKQ